ncbi:MAG: AAC(3) family N-acetyltransferase [Asgard group archaeon]|nr:AAC(3) family N-acetyltransferase [Asgard group archaeon]
MRYWEKEKQIVEKTKVPIIKEILKKDFCKIGLQKGDIVIVHSSMSKIGWIIGEAVTVIRALMEILTEEGTLVMPTMSSGNTDPANWNYPSVPKDWHPIIRKEMPPYDPVLSQTRGMGRIPEQFRVFPNVLRSKHPQASFAAWGKFSREITKDHIVEETFGKGSPIEKVYQLNGKILLIGVHHSSNTSLHFAEYLSNLPNFPIEQQGAAMYENSKRIWKSWKEIKYDADDFVEIGLAFEKSINYKTANIGLAESRLVLSREIVDFAVRWLQENRKY